MEHLDPFLARWKNAGGSERANYQSPLTPFAQINLIKHHHKICTLYTLDIQL